MRRPRARRATSLSTRSLVGNITVTELVQPARRRYLEHHLRRLADDREHDGDNSSGTISFGMPKANSSATPRPAPTPPSRNAHHGSNVTISVSSGGTVTRGEPTPTSARFKRSRWPRLSPAAPSSCRSMTAPRPRRPATSLESNNQTRVTSSAPTHSTIARATLVTSNGDGVFTILSAMPWRTPPEPDQQCECTDRRRSTITAIATTGSSVTTVFNGPGTLKLQCVDHG